ncbi:hypothetical protein [Pseudomonas sp. TH34]|uniref:hypothetical protein n=1 Tax=Pseudomonas sp. TH34 TaxID=2796399 RepID=UPI001F5BADA5|nr:hypothetical protein [Pseudomonas sp. TH34]
MAQWSSPSLFHRVFLAAVKQSPIASILPRNDKRAAKGKTIVAHLGNGASLCAMHKCVSQATSMGFSTLGGVLMGTRPGHLDPGILLYLMRERGMSVSSLEHLLYHECGLRVRAPGCVRGNL